MGFYPQPKPDPAIFERKKKKNDRRETEREVKRDVMHRDSHMCRWPRCEFRKYRVEAAHVLNAGMGGDPNCDRMTTENLLALCWLHHQGPGGLERNGLKVEAITPDGCNGPLEFWQRDPKDRWFMVARERSIRIYERD